MEESVADSMLRVRNGRKICFVLGTRPEAIKLAPVVLAARASGLDCEVCVTGQHREMLDQALACFDIIPDTNLGIMQHDQTLVGLTVRVLSMLEEFFRTHRFGMVLVQGDTTTTFCAALAAFYAGIPVGHVEAGLRTGNKFSPYPEEVNRLLTTRVTDLHFAPTEGARENLLREAVPGDRIFVTGNTVIDALELTVKRVRGSQPSISGMDSMQLDGRRLVLVTSHRREAFGDGIAAICGAVAQLASDFPDVCFAYTVHLNPNVFGPVHRRLRGLQNVLLLPPVEYLQFVWLLDRCTLVLTDSGGVQEEAPSLGKPVLVMRETTERPEGIKAGVARLVGTNQDRIASEAARLLDDPSEYERMAQPTNPYGDGCASQRIIDVCQRALTEELRSHCA
jgi:UDP-N-acetylglucosamine 2-epimerase (non-hydrolysing)